jgi:crotonobetainyl-CoA:carnitine CoA-transferase CaiB-like acyl-CoA transferase
LEQLETPGRGLAKSAGALAGIKVIDLSRVLGGPFCTMILADHGAEVIKVEPPQGDETREWGPPFLPVENERGDASYFIGINRNKRSIALDIGNPEGREVLLRLLEDADVLIENFKPGTMEKWGLGFEENLSSQFPRLVHCRISGFGGEGPLGGLPGYDAVLQAMTGLMSVNGDPTTGPLRLGTPVVDLATGMYATIGILMALQERARSGQGQYVDMALYDCGMSLLHPQAPNFFLNGIRPVPMGNSHPNVVPCDKFKTRTGEIFVVIGNDGQFRKLMREIGRADMAIDPRFLTNAERFKNKAVLTTMLADIFIETDGQKLAVQLLAAGLPVGSVLPIDEALAAEHTAAREMVAELGTYRGLGTPIKLSRTPGGLRSRPPRFAEQSEEILKETGFSDSDIRELRAANVLPGVRKSTR